MSDLTGQTALVTGATSGIGRAVAELLAQHGATVIVHGRNPERGAELVASITGNGGSARFVAADLADARDVERLAREAGAVDILVNNAGIFELASTLGTTVDSVDRHFAINARAPFQLVAALVPHMIEQDHGAIVNISSGAATTSSSVGAVYGASKAALDVFTHYWATEFGAHGIRVNAVASGPVRTLGTESMLAAAGDALDKTTARGRIGDPAEIAEVVLFLVQSRSSYVNGAVVSANGGRRSALPS
ncbi:SDR family NAD(P)-dependent oxidoreductase [Curtobacterium sp. ISL-83]|uniref:SDR family NAD(P)-dependent oxidoreductase n=1 Tax=Curtobacterium sp. ISL-83 TaxID=2819145 RepID=UPI001BE6705F|nr:SDR family oxidoreductase [Curtobacterium sp. ISL-83]MBT2501293.1 SDR family oxidoreductase [Curtobacterium sp. ISL-83]